MGKPTNTAVMMTQCVVKDVITTDVYRLSLVASARKGKRSKGIAQLLKLLLVDRSRVKVDISMAHLLGEKAVDPDAVNNEGVYCDLCLRLHDYLCETLGLTECLRMRRWNLHFDLVVTDTRGVVIFSGPVLNWTAKNLNEYLKFSEKFRRSMTAPSIIKVISFSETNEILGLPSQVDK